MSTFFDYGKCPRCEENKELSALSRRHNGVYICSACGREEALVDLSPIDDKEILKREQRLREYITKNALIIQRRK